ncbi:MAG: hypothetical protein WD794_04110 [Mycobacteriales bacterium]
MPPARRRRRIGKTPDAAVTAAVTAALEHIQALPTAAERARAATDFIARFDEARRQIALARVADVRAMLAENTLRATALALDLSVNVIVQIRDEDDVPPATRR